MRRSHRVRLDSTMFGEIYHIVAAKVAITRPWEGADQPPYNLSVNTAEASNEQKAFLSFAGLDFTESGDISFPLGETTKRVTECIQEPSALPVTQIQKHIFQAMLGYEYKALTQTQKNELKHEFQQFIEEVYKLPLTGEKFILRIRFKKDETAYRNVSPSAVKQILDIIHEQRPDASVIILGDTLTIEHPNVAIFDLRDFYQQERFAALSAHFGTYDNRYTLEAMPKKKDHFTPKSMKIYVEVKSTILEYTILPPSNKIIRDSIALQDLECTPVALNSIEKLRNILPRILETTEERGHTQSKVRNNIAAQLFFQKILQDRFGLTAAIGMKSGALDGPGFYGLPTIFFCPEKGKNRMVDAANQIPSFHAILYCDRRYNTPGKHYQKMSTDALEELKDNLPKSVTQQAMGIFSAGANIVATHPKTDAGIVVTEFFTGLAFRNNLATIAGVITLLFMLIITIMRLGTDSRRRTTRSYK